MRALRSVTRRFKRLGRACVGCDILVKRDLQCSCEVLGNVNAQFAIRPDKLREQATIYSFGIGTDISFDLELIRKFGVLVHAFDPTPRSLAWLKTQNVPAGFHAHQYGVAERDGMLRFAPPKSPAHVSHTIVQRAGSERSIWAPGRRAATIMKHLGHDAPAILTMCFAGAG